MTRWVAIAYWIVGGGIAGELISTGAWTAAVVVLMLTMVLGELALLRDVMERQKKG